MKKIITIVGARPQFIKTPLLSRELKKFAREIIVHTGQHYDDSMSKIFFRELKISSPKYNLNVGSGGQGEQTGKMIIGLEKILLQEKPDLVLIYGDTNSTLAGAISAAKLNIPLAHIEAGMRSGNMKMPEEQNRIVSDHLSTLLFCPTRSALVTLKKEGIKKNIYFVGDVMTDMIEYQKSIRQPADKKQKPNKLLKKLNLKAKNYLLVTVHRQENTDKKENLKNITSALQKISDPIVFPLHPRTRKALIEFGLEKSFLQSPHIRLLEPCGYQQMILLEKEAKLILTDSGGVQKEAYLLKTPCLTMRNETEWPETVKAGWNHLTGADEKKILSFAQTYPKPQKHPNFLGSGDSTIKIATIIKAFLNHHN